ncbi:ORF6N domain-containing protein [Pedobacter heparinus]|uniref:ORF6N domain-containing protein n=1 Tax=Pedobacter heparinus TaxID=984 RepID=UPI0029312C66|nr:ORF6N domain-containing protein [Pedobacter heparinus]
MADIIALTPETIKNQIYTIRGKQVMMDRDLAALYGVETRNLNKAVNRNITRFPKEFMFQLTDEEFKNLMFQNGTSSWGGTRKLPYVFAEHAVLMLSAVLKSETAVNVSVQIISAFIEMRKFLRDNAEVLTRLDNVERKHALLQYQTDSKFDQVFNALESGDLKPKQGIFYDGQVFDAYVFVADLVRSAKQSIALIDNYVDETVLNMFTKRPKGVSFTIYTKEVNKQLLLDKKKHDQQYEPVMIKQFKNAHDRFLIIDGVAVYHIGASLKDLGKKWFAFSKMEMHASELLKRLV